MRGKSLCLLGAALLLFLPVRANAGPTTAERAAYSVGMEALRQRNWALTSTTLTNFCATYPDSELADDAMWHLSRARKLMGDAQGGERVRAELWRKYPQGSVRQDLDLFLRGAEMAKHVTDRRWGQAQGSVDAFLREHPASKMLYRLKGLEARIAKARGIAEAQSGNDALAREYFTTADGLNDEYEAGAQGYLRRDDLSPDEKVSAELHLLEHYFNRERHDIVLAMAPKLTAQYPIGSLDELMFSTWLGIAQACQTPRDLDSAAASCERVIHAAKDAPKSDVRGFVDRFFVEATRAFEWRLWIARERNDGVALTEYLARLRADVPDFEYKDEVLARYTGSEGR